jgi:hypothetical protein
MAIFPPLINYVRWIMTETPTTFFLVGAYFFYYRKQFWLCGLMFGLAAVTRANIGPVFILLFLWELIGLKKMNYRLLVGALVPILIVSCYCYDQTGKFAIAGNARVNILYAVTASGLFGWWINRKNFMISILILPFLVVTVICVMLITIPRYGYPAEPFLVLTGAWTLVWLMRRKRFIFQP